MVGTIAIGMTKAKPFEILYLQKVRISNVSGVQMVGFQISTLYSGDLKNKTVQYSYGPNLSNY